MRVECIINTRASRAEAQLDDVLHAINKQKFSHLKITKLKNPKLLTEAVDKALQRNPDVLVLGGGDGTIISGIEHALSKKFSGSFGLLPLGTSNYLARNLGIPIDAGEALRKIKTGKAKSITFGRANKKTFSLMATIGVATRVSDNITVSLKKKFGQGAYIVEAFRQLSKAKSFNYEIEVDGRRQKLTGRSHQIVIVNADLNQQLTVLPDSSLFDPRLRLVVFNSERSILKLLLSIGLYIFSFGKVKMGLADLHAKNIKIKTSNKQQVALDGEVVTQTPVAAELVPQAIKIIA